MTFSLNLCYKMRTYSAEEIAEMTRTDRGIIEEGDQALLRLSPTESGAES
ncbi:hypothetical protein SAMN04489842_2201 [Natronobacterium texcoconense]|uniref:Uncharacterized protein n=1 Tax=Natronobacterium texcoconense TaxID=1095778 RepID=A0A1H1G1J1_NATTX|nr:hypothetical protein SAMN04489842_2201 [Natronobacterium texcoconense]